MNRMDRNDRPGSAVDVVKVVRGVGPAFGFGPSWSFNLQTQAKSFFLTDGLQILKSRDAFLLESKTHKRNQKTPETDTHDKLFFCR